jgi:hypothetical protein
VSRSRWTWAGAVARGTSHLRAGTGCDDSGACVEVLGPHDTALIMVASDGAGSAKHSAIGSRIASRAFVESAAKYVKSGRSIRDISGDIVKEWLDGVRDRIAAAAVTREAMPREFAATLVASLVGMSHAAFVHVGDGASVFQGVDDGAWTVASWPAQGQYAATTYFVTDDPEPNCRIVIVDQEVNVAAVFTDGIERLVLDFSTRSAFSPFFDKMFKPLSRTLAGRDRVLSEHLAEFLNGPAVCEKTDDDKTLILAKRTGI